MSDIDLKQGAVRSIESLLVDGNGVPLDLSGSPPIFFQMWSVADGTLKIDELAEIVDVDTAHVRYNPTVVDTDTAGDYLAHWRVIYAEGPVIVPEKYYLLVRIWGDLVDVTT